MTAAHQEALTDDGFEEFDQLEVIESTELKLGGVYHAYTYIAAEDTRDVVKG